ncbi:MAG: NUDIX domain-containing protein [Candidatus Amulumruptor caecigallinarius]|nr:NUDIX domain-containing protein [Candidatus Amulumruptor caecigallinarius]
MSRVFKFCPECGFELNLRDLGDDKDIPWCDHCGRPWFPMFPVAVIALVYNNEKEVLLLRQNYISSQFHNLVSGYVKPDETAESCVVREIKEETGLDVKNVQLIFTHWFERKQMMMIGFFAEAQSNNFKLSVEVDDATWVNANEMLSLLSNRPGSTSRILAENFLQKFK